MALRLLPKPEPTPPRLDENGYEILEVGGGMRLTEEIMVRTFLKAAGAPLVRLVWDRDTGKTYP